MASSKGTGKLLQSVQKVCDQTNLSARLVQHTNGKVHAYDCPQWSNKTALLFRFQEPNAIVCVEQSVASLSGFVLIIEEKKARHVGLRIIMAILSTCFVYLALWLLCSHINHSVSVVNWPFLSLSNIFNTSSFDTKTNASSCKK